MHLFSADVEITAPIFIKAANLEDFRQRSQSIDGHGIYVWQNGLFSDRGFEDSKLRTVSFTTVFTLKGLWPGKQPFDFGLTMPPKRAPGENQACEIGEVRLFGSNVRIAATIYIKGRNKQAASKILSALIGRHFKFDPTDDQFFEMPPIHEDGVEEISFGTEFVLHRALEELTDEGPCPKWRFEERRLLASSIQSPKLTDIPFPIENLERNALSAACGPTEIRGHLKKGYGWFKARPIFRGKDLSVKYTNSGCTIDLHGNDPFPIPGDMVAFLIASKDRYSLRNGGEARLDCRYIEYTGLAPWLDIYQLSFTQDGMLEYQERWETRIGELMDYFPFPLEEESLDPEADFMAETRRVMDIIAAENLAFVDEVEAILWFPTDPTSFGTYQTVLIDVKDAGLS